MKQEVVFRARLNDAGCRALRRGDIVCNRGSGISYVVEREAIPGRPAVGVLTVEICGSEWELVRVEHHEVAPHPSRAALRGRAREEAIVRTPAETLAQLDAFPTASSNRTDVRDLVALARALVARAEGAERECARLQMALARQTAISESAERALDQLTEVQQ